MVFYEGNVLIGTTTDRGHRLTIGSPDGAANLTSTTLNNSMLFVGMSNSIDSYGMNFWTEGSGNGFIQQGRTDEEQPSLYNLILQPFGGKVGVGTPDPKAKLEVNGAVMARGQNATTGGEAFYWGTEGQYAIGSNKGFDFYLWTATSADFRLGTSAIERMRINANGNVLIGTTTDSGYKLDVNGDAHFTGLITADSGIKIGDATITWDASANALKIDGNIYATGKFGAKN
jgi:hypothetical protein